MAIIKIKNPAIDLDAAEIPNLDASKITSGTFADARIAASNVSQHATSFDDNKLVNDLSTLGLRVHTQENLNVSNTNSASFDVFQDSSGITNLTNAARNENEYVSSISFITPTRTHDADSTGTDGDYSYFRWTGVGTGTYSANQNETAELLIVAGGGGGGTPGGEGGGGGAGGLVYYGSETPKTPNGSAISLTSGTTYTATVGAGGTGATSYGTNGGNGTSGGNSSFTGSGLSLITALGGGTGGNYPDDGVGHGDGVAGGSGGGGGGNNQSTGRSQTGGAGTSGQGNAGGNGARNANNQFEGGGGGGAGAAGEAGTVGGSFKAGDGGVGLAYSIMGSSTYFAGGGGGATNGGTNGSGGNGGGGTGNGSDGTDGLGGGGGGASGDGGNGTVILRVPTQQSIANATGSFEGSTITAGVSTSSMGAVITYQDAHGTNTLNTDIVLKLSADNGSNYSTATLTALPNFATGIKMAKVNDLSVTAGTQLKYKIEFANQASGSKEARIRGVSLQY